MIPVKPATSRSRRVVVSLCTVATSTALLFGGCSDVAPTASQSDPYEIVTVDEQQRLSFEEVPTFEEVLGGTWSSLGRVSGESSGRSNPAEFRQDLLRGHR